MRNSKTGFLMLFIVLGITPSVFAQTAASRLAALPYPDAATPPAVDHGALDAQPGGTPISATVALNLPNLNEAEDLLKSLYTPGDPLFHHFLTASQFVARFAPAGADVAKIIASLAKYGLTAVQTTATTLKVTGTPANMERAFAVSLHSYEVPAHGNIGAYAYHAPLMNPSVPSEISGSVATVTGLDNRPSLRPRYTSVPHSMGVARSVAKSGGTGNPFGSLTVTDFANNYDVKPLYERGVTGRGHTLGIITLASFTPSDAYAYWKAVGLDVAPDRIKIVNIDGGPGAPSDASGSLETTIDVEHSGGIAPGAKIIVYQAPNTNQGYLDLFAAAVDSNAAETLSTSWGFWEWFNNLQNAPVTDPITGKTVSDMQATHELLVRAAIQGQTVSAASGDGGAYDVNNDLGCFGPYSPAVPQSCSQPLAVDYPASDTAITAAGGTTLPGTLELCLNSACTPPFFTINHRNERVWGWDYLEGWCAAMGTPDPISCGIFPGGTGGGVSVFFQTPSYQFGIKGIQHSQPGQVWQAGPYFYNTFGVGTFFALPPHYPGRNVPDVSFNADPFTGYAVYYTSSVTGFGIQSGWGGTSFVAPELNGVSALLGDYVHGRIGLLNYPLYNLAHSDEAYDGQDAPLNAIPSGDNWFYHGSSGYSPAAGVGTMDVANFADFLRDQF